MRSKPNLRADKYRKAHPVFGTSKPFSNWGYFEIGPMAIISSGDAEAPQAQGWEHVSVSLRDRCPTWEEMCKVKDLFWQEEEVVIQIHPAKSKHVNNHPFCLHLWRKPTATLDLPPPHLVG